MTSSEPAPTPQPSPAPSGAEPRPGPAALPPDPAAYDSPRATLARARGLSAPYIAGGRDPDPEPALREDRYYGRLLIAMVVAVVASGFIMGIVANVIEALGG